MPFVNRIVSSSIEPLTIALQANNDICYGCFWQGSRVERSPDLNCRVEVWDSICGVADQGDGSHFQKSRPKGTIFVCFADCCVLLY